MAGEFVETSRLWGRDVSRIDPAWIEPLAEHLVKRSYAEPHWERKRGGAVALETVTLYGIPVVTGRRMQFLDRVDSALARELFIRHALVEGDWDTRATFFHANRRLLADVADLEERTRRRDIVVDEETLVDFYDARIPADVVSARHFESWWKKAGREQPDLLTFDRDLLVRDEADAVPTAWSSAYPDEWRVGDATATALVRLRAGRRPGRGHRRRAAVAAAPPAGRGLRLAGAGAAARSRDRADPVAAETTTPPAGAGPGSRRPSGRDAAAR